VQDALNLKKISTVLAAAGAGVVLMAVPAHAAWHPTGRPQHRQPLIRRPARDSTGQAGLTA
jgi:hypothetical protein